ncbi:hypothetical protein D6774_03870 [Candidatus Woesearchaeota archaeon]|nr:MAG: hypothetical protein D6774_03870 [Candidatus Woesearchaeota archaeon]
MILREELIGRSVQAVDKYTNQTITGVIVDETYHTFIINDKRVVKKDVILKLNQHVIDGSLLEKRPHDRIKAKFRIKKETKL